MEAREISAKRTYMTFDHVISVAFGPGLASSVRTVRGRLKEAFRILEKCFIRQIFPPLHLNVSVK